MWKLKKKLCPRNREAHSVMNDKYGNVITSDKALKESALQVYEERLKGNKMENNLKQLETDTNTLCEIRVRTSQSNKTQEGTFKVAAIILATNVKTNSRLKKD